MPLFKFNSIYIVTIVRTSYNSITKREPESNTVMTAPVKWPTIINNFHKHERKRGISALFSSLFLVPIKSLHILIKAGAVDHRSFCLGTIIKT